MSTLYSRSECLVTSTHYTYHRHQADSFVTRKLSHRWQTRCIRSYFDSKTSCAVAASVHFKLHHGNSLYYNVPKCQKKSPPTDSELSCTCCGCILQVSPHHSPHLRSHNLSLPRPFTPELKLICFINPFLHSHSGSIWTAFIACLDRSYWALTFVISGLITLSFSVRVKLVCHRIVLRG